MGRQDFVEGIINYMKFKTVFLNIFVSALLSSGVIAIMAFLFSDFGNTVSDLLITLSFLAIYSFFALSSGVLYDQKKYPYVFYLGIGASLIGFLYTTGVIWDFINIRDEIKFGIILFILAASIAHTSLLLQIQSEKAITKTLSIATIFCIGAVAALLIFLILNEFGDVEEFYYRLLGVLVVLDVLGTIITSLSNRIDW